MKSRWVGSILIGASIWVFSTSGQAATQSVLYGSDQPGNLVRIDEATGVGTPVCTLAQGGTEIVFDGLTGQSFQQQPDGSFTIVQFDLNTCANLGPVVPDSHSFTGMEFVGGTLYGAGIDCGGCASTLYTLNPATGASTSIGLTGVALPLSGLAYDGGSATMYGIAGGAGPANLYTIDLSTGVATLVGSTGIQAGSLRFGSTGTLFAGGTGPDSGNLYRVNLATGAATLVGNTGLARGVTGLLLANATAVPTVNAWGLMAMLLLLAAAGVYLGKRAVV